LDGGESTDVTATVYDESGNPIAGVEVVFTLDDPTMASIDRSAVTSSSGVATVTLTARDLSGQVNVTATVESIQNDPPERIAIAGDPAPVEPAEPASISLAAAQDTLNSGQSTDITATVYDQSGNTVSAVEIVFTLDDPTMASVTHSAITSSSGEATVTLTARDLSGQVNVTATAGSIQNDPPERIAITGDSVPDEPAEPASVSVVASLDALNPGEPTDVTASVYDQSGNPIAGVKVDFILDDPTMASITGTATTSASGIAVVTLTARDTAGEVNVTAIAGSVQNSPPETITISGEPRQTTPPAPAAVLLVASENTINPEASTDVTATVYDESGNTVSGVEVVFTLDEPILGSITHIVITSSLGNATATFTARTFPGEVNVTAGAGFVQNDPPERISIAGDPVPPASAEPAAIGVTAALDSINPSESTDITAIVYDASGNPIAGVEVAFSLDDPTMASITSSAITSSSGSAIVTLTARDAAGEVNVTASAGSVQNSPPEPITIIGEPRPATPPVPAAVLLVASQNPINPQASTDVTATVYDESGNTMSGVEVTFTLDVPILASITHIVITSSSGSATATFTARALPGEVNVTASAGFAQNDPAERITIAGDPTPPASVEPNAIDVAAALDSLNPGEATDVTATVYDAGGNPIAGVEVEFSLDDPTMASITNSAITSSSGSAIVTLTARDLAGEVNVTATVGSVQNIPAERVTIAGEAIPSIPPEPEAVRLTALQTTVDQGQSTDITAVVYDESGNTMAGVEVVFTLDEPTMASITHSVITSATGEAAAILTAGDTAGDVNVTATAGSAQSDPPLTITIP